MACRRRRFRFASAPRLMPADAPRRAAVAPVHSDDPGWLHLPELGGAREIGRGQCRHYAVGASGRRMDLRVLGPLARPITRMQAALAPASSLAVPPAADPPPR